MKIIIKPKYLAVVIVKGNVHQWLYLKDLWIKVKGIFKKNYVDITIVRISENKYKVVSVKPSMSN